MAILTQKVKPLVLCILDGWGLKDEVEGNAIKLANPQNFNNLWQSYPHAKLINYGTQVGFSASEVGNSEVGHLNLGAGRIVLQNIQRIDLAISDGSFFENEAFIKAIENCKKNNSNLHIFGLVSTGVVHSSQNHLYALLALFQKYNISEKVKLHIFTDGRDSSPKAGLAQIKELESKINSENLGEIASISGRYYAMDRDNRWERTELAYNAILGKSPSRAHSASQAIEHYYQNDLTDEFIIPTTIVSENGASVGSVRTNDSIVFFNFRPDRARQLTKAFTQDEFKNVVTSSGEKVKTFDRGQKISGLFFVTLTQYEKGLKTKVAFDPKEVEMPLARVLSQKNMHQLHIAETEKYAHVTYFFNGGNELPYVGEDRVLINSKKVASYDLEPEMSASEITKELTKRLETRTYDFIVVNYANADMVSHTGNLQSTIKAIQALDFNLEILVKTTLSVGGAVIITSDHGNAEEMLNTKSSDIDTEHNKNLSPFILVASELKGNNVELPSGILADVSPTILSILKIPKPPQMTGRSLI